MEPSMKIYALFQGPFSTFKYKIESGCDWTGIKFSLDGKLMMLTTNGAVIRVLDAFEGKPLHTLQGYLNNKVINNWTIILLIEELK